MRPPVSGPASSRERTGKSAEERSGREPTFCLLKNKDRFQPTDCAPASTMALQLDTIRATADRVAAFDGTTITLALSAIKQKGKSKKTITTQIAEIPFSNIEKANLVAEI